MNDELQRAADRLAQDPRVLAVYGFGSRDDIDLVVLNQAPPLLAYEVVAAGCRLFSGDEEVSDHFEARAAMRCFDTEWLRTVQQRYAREAWSGPCARP